MKFVPEEFSTSWGVLRSMGDAASDAGFVARHSLAFAVCFIAGFTIGWLVFPGLSSAGKESALFALLGGIIALGGLLSGFMVTLMLFSGRLEGTVELQVEDVLRVIGRIKLLLYSQAQTLFASVLASIFSIVWLCAYAVGHDGLGQRIIAGACFGYLLVAVVRSVLVPLQIFEFHESYLEISKMSVIARTNERLRSRPAGTD
ncbi:hypothetical protein [Stenotrophomonas maltophilia]|uniref:hypothetical protein n=1 Tax=Stenotrophomonas maltophilia TaxID=40324 RepID=UPI0012AF099A|nr:hypothetical protein [Stenotrophomonas maltophilia]QGM06080.1 hypothetical protein FEO88_14905 [Stenotrophomonas maltophilia]